VAGPHSNRSVGRTTKARADADWRETISVHPIVATHPETGRKLLFVNHSYTVGIEGLTDDEARPLLAFLMDHGHRPEFTCRFRWTRGAVAFWDNRCVKHLAVNDAGPFRRVMRRIQIA
jgi:taurine dioxygenase